MPSSSFLHAYLLPFSSSSTYKVHPDIRPPGPRPLPVIGNLLLLDLLPHRDVANLSKIYGPILHLRLGSTPPIFTPPALAEQVFKDTVFANRLLTEVAEILSYGLKVLIFDEYAPRWRKLRNICVNILLSSAKLDSYKFIRREEVANFVNSLQHAAKARAVVDVTTKVQLLVADMVCRIVMGMKSMDGAEFSEHVDKVMRIFGSFNLNDDMPWLGLLDLQGLRRWSREMKEHIDEIVDEHVRLRDVGKQQHKKDFVDIMLDSMGDGA